MSGGATLPTANRGWITACLVTATMMQTLDTTIANVALPYMQGSLAASQDQINWVLTSYIVAAAIATPPTGWLAANFGRKRLLLTAVFGFMVASALCGLARSMEEMVLFRLLQGVFGASLVPLSQSTLLDLHAKEEQGKAMGIWGLGVMVGPILGPTVGGWLTSNYDWRWVFFINVPIGLTTLLGLATFLREPKSPAASRFDWFGFATLSIGIGALQLLLDRGEQKDWFSSIEIIVEAAISALAFYFFFIQITTAERPFIKPALFKDRNFAASCVFIFLVGIILLATLSLLTPFLQELIGYPVVQAGLVMAPRGLGTMVSMLLIGRLVGRIDNRLLLAMGIMMMTHSLYLMTGWTPDVSQKSIVLTGLEQGFGIGFVWVPLSTMAFSTLGPALRTEGASMFSLMRNIGGSIGISYLSTLLLNEQQTNHADIVGAITPFNPLFQTGIARRMLDPSLPGSAAVLDGMVRRQAMTIAFLDDFKFMMCLGLIALPLVLVLRGPKREMAEAPAGHAAAME